MNFIEAVRLMKQGKGVRLNGIAYYITNACDIIDSCGYRYIPNIKGILSDEWEEVVETHDWSWAYNQMKYGHAVRRLKWYHGICIDRSNRCFAWSDHLVPVIIDPDSLDANDWVLWSAK